MEALVDHIAFLKNAEKPKDSLENFMAEPIRMGAVYWGVTALSLLGDPYAEKRDEIFEFVWSCWNEDGGFGCSPNHDSHITHTHYALLILLELDSFGTLGQLGDHRRSKIVGFVKSLQNEDGSFRGDIWGEVDLRFIYNAVSICCILNATDTIREVACERFIQSCRNFDGAFGAIPESESHAAYTFCAVAALSLLNRLDDSNEDRLGWWLAERQIPSNGGFNGRPEKAPDVCYSWWILSSVKLLGCEDWIDLKALRSFILQSQDLERGGIADRPGFEPDVFHTFFGLAGLSLIRYSIPDVFKTGEESKLQKIDLSFAISEKSVRKYGLEKFPRK